MRLSHLNAYLDITVSNQDVSEGKPNPMMYSKAMGILGVAPNECLILEDNEHGIQAAMASGAHLLRIGVPADVTYQTIVGRITEIETA